MGASKTQLYLRGFVQVFFIAIFSIAISVYVQLVRSWKHSYQHACVLFLFFKGVSYLSIAPTNIKHILAVLTCLTSKIVIFAQLMNLC